MNKIIKLQVIVQSLAILLLSSSLAFGVTPKKTSTLPAYQIGPGDVLNVSVWKEDGLEKEVLIRPDGGMSFPLAGDVQAGGKTTSQLQKVLTDRIKRFIPDPVITVSVRKIENNKIFIVGKVNRPGEYVATHYVDVMQALAMSGGLNAYASANNIKILRRVNGEVRSIPFEYGEVQSGDELQQNIILKSGDVVVVP